MEQTTTTIESNLDEIKKTIEKTEVYHFQEMLVNAIGTVDDFKLLIAWDTLEALPKRINDCISILQNHSFWMYLYRGVARYLSEAPYRKFFAANVTNLTIEFINNESSHLCFTANVLTYKINSDYLALLPNDVYQQIMVEFQDYFDTTVEEKEGEQKPLLDLSDFVVEGKSLETLKNIAKDDNCKDLLESYINTSRTLWQPTKTQQQQIDVCKRLLISTEHIIRVWTVMKVNIKFLYQERVFVLTDQNFYTFKLEKNEVNLKHTKSYKVDEVVLMDVGRFVDKMGKKQKKQDGYGLAIFTNEDIASDDIHSAGKTKKGAIRVLRSDTKLNSRPATDNLRVHHFAAPESVYQSSDQFTFLLEIAWCIYIVAKHHKKDTDEILYAPYEDMEIEKPKNNLGSFIYNKLGLGKSNE